MEDTQNTGSISYPSNTVDNRLDSSVGALLKGSKKLLPILREEFRGEVTVQYNDGSVEKQQMYKPLFVKVDFKTDEPLMKEVTYKDSMGPTQIYIPNDEAINELLGMLKFMGLNDITPITNISMNLLMDDLMEFESKLAAILMLKQKQWGIDKALLPMTMTKIKTIVQDARHMAVNGSTLRAIQKTVQRIEHSTEGGQKSKWGRGPLS